MHVKNEVLVRVYILLFGLIIPVAIILLVKTVVIGVGEGERWRNMGKDNYVKYIEIEADRGNILADDGSVLATSIPYFDIYFDPVAPSEADFNAHLDSLAYCLANFVDHSYTVGGYRDRLWQLRQDSSDRHVLIKRKVSYSEKRQIEAFPLFNLGQFRGGFIAERRSERKRPFGLLAQRTIGYVRPGAKPVGLEGYFNEILGGEPGGQFMINVDRRRDLWMPLQDLTSVEPSSGQDVVTTVDINLQDIVENALLRGVNYHDAAWGTVVLMEVQTGAIKAIANLGKYKDTYWERYNHAVGSAIEPGSTFKLASILALLEDGYVSLDDSVNIERGKTTFYDEVMVDASPESFLIDSTSVRRVFEISSNVGMAKLVNRFYGSRPGQKEGEGPERFIRRLKQFNLNLPTGIEIEGEANPYIKEAFSEADQWSGTTLPWMSIGYELMVTPLQLLTFYNAVANDGRMMKPYLVKRVEKFGEVQQEYKPTVINRRIASKEAIDLAHELLRGVVDSGTAKKLDTDRYDFAGKTGTAQINYRRMSESTQIGGYQASFVGFFPADNPRYSCIVVINDPNRNGIYGGEVAGPVFREIADQIYAGSIELHAALNEAPRPVLTEGDLPGFDIGESRDMITVLDYLDMQYRGQPAAELAAIRPTTDTLVVFDRNLPPGVVPAVTGMNLKDALFVLENRGLKVEAEGVGKVVRQSIKPGTSARGQAIKLYLR